MRPYIARDVPKEAWPLFDHIRKVVLALPNHFPCPFFFLGQHVGEELITERLYPNCHTLSHALAQVFPVEVHDGFVVQENTQGIEVHFYHSWLSPAGDSTTIIDPQPLGVVTGPVLILKKYAIEYGPECSFLHHQGEEFQTKVEVITKEIERIMSNTT